MEQHIVAQVRELADRQAIRDCMHRYLRGLDRHDVDLVASCYHPDAVDDHGFYVGSGRGLAEEAIAGQEELLRSQHHITNHLVELDGDTAHAETYHFVVRRHRDDTVSLARGRYADRFERRDGERRIAARVVVVEAIAESPLADMETIDRIFAPAARDETDVSYQRPLAVARTSAGEEHATPVATT